MGLNVLSGIHGTVQIIIVGLSKLKNLVILENVRNGILNFQNWSKALCLRVSESTKRLATQEYSIRFAQEKMKKYPYKINLNL